MAEGNLKEKLEDQVNCPICLETYSDPKLLQCFHVYCRKCLIKLVDRDQQGQLVVICPICRQVSPVPANGVAGFQPAFHINRLLEILEDHKRAKDAGGDSAGAGAGASAGAGGGASAGAGGGEERLPSASAGLGTTFCPEHSGKEVELYCEACAELVCWKCAIKGGKHHSHDHLVLSEAFERYKDEITSSLEPMEKQLTTIGRALMQLDEHCGEIVEQQSAIQADIDNSISQLQEILAARKGELTNQLHQLTQAKLKELAAQRDQLETTQAQLSSCLEFIKESLKTDSRGEVLKMKTSVSRQVKELIVPFERSSLTPIRQADAMLSFAPSMSTLCQHYGTILSTTQPDPAKCHLAGSGLLMAAAVGVESTALVETVNYRNEPCQECVERLECELVSEATGITTCGTVERKGASQHQISYQPAVKGRHQLHIRISGQHIRGSPFSFAARASSNEMLGSAVLAVGGVEAPWGVGIGKGGQMVVSDLDSYCVTVFSPSGERMASFGSRGCGPGQFESPCGVVLDHHDNIIVTDCENHRIQKFSADGHFLGGVGSFGVNPLQFMFPRGISLNPINHRLYVAEGDRIHVLYSDLTFSMTFGCAGSGCGQFSSPCGVACDSTGKVYVADSGNHRIQVFTPMGHFLSVFGATELYFPDGIAVDTSGLVYVSEGRNHRVSVFTSGGVLVTTVGGEGQGEGLFTRPCGLALNTDGSVLYVCDSGNKRLQRFKVLEHFFSPIFLYLHRHLNELFLKNKLTINNLVFFTHKKK